MIIVRHCLTVQTSGQLGIWCIGPYNLDHCLQKTTFSKTMTAHLTSMLSYQNSNERIEGKHAEKENMQKMVSILKKNDWKRYIFSTAIVIFYSRQGMASWQVSCSVKLAKSRRRFGRVLPGLYFLKITIYTLFTKNGQG